MPKKGRAAPESLLGTSRDRDGLVAAARGFLEYLRTKGYSEKTILNRAGYLGGFIAWCGERGITTPGEVTKKVLERYQRWVYHYRKANGQPLSFRSQHSRLSPLRVFFRYLAKQNLILYNPASELELPRLEKRLPKHVLSAAEAERVLNQTDVTGPLGVRDRAILETLYSTGMRRGEVIALSLYDLDVERGTVMVRQGKGKKDRMIPIGERAVLWIEKYLVEVRPSLVVDASQSALFLTSLGDPFSPNRLTELVRDYVVAAELGKSGGCHLFRHTMATLMLEHGADIRFIQAMLGHAELSTTQIYTQVSIRKLKEIHAATHPAEHARRRRRSAAAARDELVSCLAADSDDDEQADAGDQAQ